MPFCRKCGVELQIDDKFCPNCGATFTPAQLRQGAAEVRETVASVAGPAIVAPPPQPAPEPVNSAQQAPAAPVQGKHVFQGYVSIIVALAGFGVYFIPIAYSNRFVMIFFAFFIEAIAVAAGNKATERGDKFGSYALIIAAIVIILGIVTLLVA